MAANEMSATDEIRVFSLNCWGLKYLAKWRYERLSQIGKDIAALDPHPHIVGLQECWTQQDYREIRERTKHFLPFGKFYFSGVFGGGLAILSKWPIVHSSMYQYPLNGRPTAFFRGDWFVGKGVACATLQIGPEATDLADVFCTHLHAPYEAPPNDSYICHRTAQAWEIAKLMRGAVERGRLAIGVGDFNMVPLSLAHQLIEAHAPVRDVWRVVKPDSSIGSAISKEEKARGKPMPDVAFNLSYNGTTCDSIANTWRWNKEDQKLLIKKGKDRVVGDHESDPRAKRLDYIFFGAPRDEAAGTVWSVAEVALGMTQRHPTLKCSLSDHYSVEATLSRNKSDALEAHVVQSTKDALPSETYNEILEMIMKYTARERRQRRLRLTHFGGSVILSIGCFVAIWWSPRNFVAFILTFLSTLSFGAGILDGLIGGLFVSSELRALKEFEWEIRNAQAAVNKSSLHGQDRLLQKGEKGL